jgi:hypothetical protein
MKTIQTTLALAALCFLSGCAATIVTKNNQAKITIPEGALHQYPQPGQTVEWSGEKNEKGFAHGPGTETWLGPDGNKVRETELTYNNGIKNGPYTQRVYKHGKLSSESKGTFVNSIVVGESKSTFFQPEGADDSISASAYYNQFGQLHGEHRYRLLNGGQIVSHYSNGSQISSTTYNRDGTVKQAPVQQRTASSSSSDDDELLGALFALGGAAGGNADVTMSGVSMMAGDKRGAMRHMQNFANSAPGSNGTAPGGAGTIRSVSSNSRNVSGPNLVDKYGLGKYRNQQDHITHYLAAADESYERYKQTGDSAFYDQHREYANLAKEVHGKTATKGTKLSR